MRGAGKKRARRVKKAIETLGGSDNGPPKEGNICKSVFSLLIYIKFEKEQRALLTFVFTSLFRSLVFF